MLDSFNLVKLTLILRDAIEKRQILDSRNLCEVRGGLDEFPIPHI
jgi:hypothetical protein